MEKVLYPAEQRGHNDLGWLQANFSFSFGPYYNPNRIRFGALRVLNDDFIAADKGFGMHPHDNMEIITIVLQGALEHKDSVGGDGIIHAGDVQIITAGTGVMHSEYNPLKEGTTNSLQIWVYPKLMNIPPRYQQKSFNNQFITNKLTLLLSPEDDHEALTINQDAYFYIGEFEQGNDLSYQIKKPGNGVYLFLIEGAITTEGTELNSRDAIGIYDTISISIRMQAQSRLLIMDVPMTEIY